MKLRYLFFLLCVGLLTWTGCEDDDDTLIETLNYDGPNFIAPQLPEGNNFFAAFFPEGEVQAFQGRTLEAMTFYLSEIPDALSIHVYAEGPNDRTPGDVLFSRDLSGRTFSTGWVEERIVPAIELGNEGIWLAVEVDLSGADFLRSVGCDDGGNFDPNGSWLNLAGADEWLTFNELNGERVNWNIRGIIGE